MMKIKTMLICTAVALVTPLLYAELLVGWDFEQGDPREAPGFKSDAVTGSFEYEFNNGRGSSDGTWGTVSTSAPGTNGLYANKLDVDSADGGVKDLTMTVAAGYSVTLSSLNFDWMYPFKGNGITVTYHSGDLDVADGTVLYTAGNPAEAGGSDVDINLGSFLSDVTLVAGEKITLRFALTGDPVKADSTFIDNTAIFGTATAVPEPATLGLLATMSFFLLMVRRIVRT